MGQLRVCSPSPAFAVWSLRGSPLLPPQQSRGSPGAPGTGLVFPDSNLSREPCVCCAGFSDLVAKVFPESARFWELVWWVGFGASGAAGPPYHHLTVLLVLWALQNP